MARSKKDELEPVLSRLIQAMAAQDVLASENRKLAGKGFLDTSAPRIELAKKIAEKQEEIDTLKRILEVGDEVVDHFTLMESMRRKKSSTRTSIRAKEVSIEKPGEKFVVGEPRVWDTPPPAPPVEFGIDEIRCKYDFVYFCANCLEIPYRPGMLATHPAGGFGPFLLTEAQIMVIGVIINQLLVERVPTRVVILKSRQLGCTTLLLAFWVWMLLTNDHYHIMFIIDKDAHGRTKRLEIIRWLEVINNKFDFFPGIEKKDDKFLRFTNGSILFFESAEAPNPGTSEMLHGLHESEKPKWPNGRADQVEASITPSIPAAELTIHVDESTAMGQDAFQARWQVANDGKANHGALRWIPIFLPWYFSKEYYTQPPRDFSFINDDDELKDISTDEESGEEILLTEEEYARKYKLSFGQIYWRRAKIKQSFRGNRSMFDQEFPTTADHAWRSVQQPFFPRRMIDRAERTKRQPLIFSIGDKDGYNNHNQEVLHHRLNPVVFPNSMGDLQIWEPPKQGYKYYAGLDVSEGKATVNSHGELDQDWTRMSIKREDGQTVAMFKTRERVETIWLPVILICKYYNMAWLNGERNAIGLVVLVAILRTGYPNILVQSRPEGRPVEDRAWTTVNKGNRETLLTQLRASYNAGFQEIWSEELLSEMKSFIRAMKGGTPRLEARSGTHDDAIFSELHAEKMRSTFTTTVLVPVDKVPVREEQTEINAYVWTDECVGVLEDEY